MADETNKWAKLSGVSEETLRYYNEKRVVSRQELATIIRKSEKAIQRYVKDGMPICVELHQRLFQIFYLDECLEWIDKNIDKKQSKRTSEKKDKKINIEDNTVFDKSKNNYSEKEIDIREQLIEIEKYLSKIQIDGQEQDELSTIISNMDKLVKIKTILGELVPVKNVQKAMIELTSGLVTELKRSVKIIPSECENRSKLEIREILDRSFEATSKRIIGVAETRMMSNERIFDIMEAVYDCILSGVEVDKIISKVKEL